MKLNNLINRRCYLIKKNNGAAGIHEVGKFFHNKHYTQSSDHGIEMHSAKQMFLYFKTIIMLKVLINEQFFKRFNETINYTVDYFYAFTYTYLHPQP